MTTGKRHELTDAAWAVIWPLLPQRSRGRPWKDHRRVINGILWVLATGVPWRDAPERYGPWQTLYDRFVRWTRDGTWERILAALLSEMERRGQIDGELFCVDGTSIRALKAAAGARGKNQDPGRAPRPRPRAEPGWHRLQAPRGMGFPGHDHRISPDGRQRKRVHRVRRSHGVGFRPERPRPAPQAAQAACGRQGILHAGHSGLVQQAQRAGGDPRAS